MIKAMDELHAAIDANFNRSMEGLRVCEDVCRFVLHDEILSTRAKEYRHVLAELSSLWMKIDLLSARDIATDPIKFVHLEETTQKGNDNPIEVLFLRNIRRAIEAVRSIEECARIDNKDHGNFQSLRFQLYAFEAEVVDAITRKHIQRKFHNALYAILEPTFAGEDLRAAAAALIEGGARVIQLRMKHAPTKEIMEHARIIGPICKKKGVVFIINDRPDIARCVDADGVHVGQDDMPVADARRIVGVGKIVGKSTHSLKQAREAQKEFPDYIAIGPVFDTASKDGSMLRGIGIDAVRMVAHESNVPVVAIGGITPDVVDALKDAGSTCPAVMSALFSGDVVRNAREFTAKLSENT